MSDPKIATTLTDQAPYYVQAMIATRGEWEAIYHAIPASDESGAHGEIDNECNGIDFDQEVALEFVVPHQVASVIRASVVLELPIRYGNVRMIPCGCDDPVCCKTVSAELAKAQQ